MKNFILFICIFITAGCGYTTRGFVYDNNSIVITPIVNKINITSENRGYSGYNTYPILLEKRLTNKLINAFNIDGNLKISNEGSGKAMKLVCAVLDYRKDAIMHSDDDDVEEQRLRLSVEMKLYNSVNEVIKSRKITGQTEYYLTGVNRESETSAQNDLLEDTSRRILEAVVDGWQ